MKTIGQLLFVFFVFVGLLGGWILNIIDLCFEVAAAPTVGDLAALTILRVVGIFVAPLGAVLGWFF